MTLIIAISGMSPFRHACTGSQLMKAREGPNGRWSGRAECGSRLTGWTAPRLGSMVNQPHKISLQITNTGNEQWVAHTCRGLELVGLAWETLWTWELSTAGMICFILIFFKVQDQMNISWELSPAYLQICCCTEGSPNVGAQRGKCWLTRYASHNIWERTFRNISRLVRVLQHVP